MNSNLKIEKPCEESFANMIDVLGGKFCNLCSKNVFDFSDFNTVEIQQIIQQNKGNKICGIFFKSQQDIANKEERVIPTHHSSMMNFSKVAAGLALTAAVIQSYPAQTKAISTQETTNKIPPKNENTKISDGNILLTGKVTSSDKGIPVEAKVSFLTALKVYSVFTDKNGFYSLEVPKEILKYESLLEFSPLEYIYDGKLVIYKIQDLKKKQVIVLDYNGIDKMYGEVSMNSPYAEKKSFVILDGKKIEPKTFNKSYGLFSNRYDVHFIPKEFVSFFTKKEGIENIYIVFTKPK